MSRLWGSSYGTLSQTYGQDDFRPVEDVDEVVPGFLVAYDAQAISKFPSFFILHGIKDSSDLKSRRSPTRLKVLSGSSFGSRDKFR
jgi:hypothetical protein